MKLRTEIDSYKSSMRISHQSKILMLGSCFTDSIGEIFIDNKFNVIINPFGTLYNPTSICRAIELLLDEKVFAKEDSFLNKGMYNSFSHHSSFSNSNRENFLATINEKRNEASERLKAADILFITFGTSYVFRHKEQSEVVANCHKLPAALFDRYQLSIADIVKQWHNLILKLKSFNPKLQIVFTVSPIRHLKDGAHNNQLSKSILLLAIDKLCQVNVNAHYFPSYEILVDDLRDYRFYEQDMVHPNALAIEYIWRFFREIYLSQESEEMIREWEKIRKALNHRPFNQETEEHIQFLKQTLLKLNKFGAKFPYICLTREQSELENRIK